MNLLPALIVCHLCGDFLFQSHWMQRKAQSSFVCAVHVATYALPFALLLYLGAVPAWLFAALITEHFLQDRFALHVRWMRLIQQTTPAQWPIGPLCVDQAMHITFIGILCGIASLIQ